MPDYYSILSKAVSVLEPNTASARQRLYERARSAMSAEFDGASPPFDASDIGAVKQGLKRAIERIEAEALPAWLQQPERAECANDCSTTADLLHDHGAYRFLDASEIAAAKQGLERAVERIEAEATLRQQPEVVVCTNDCPVTTDLPTEIAGVCPSLHDAGIAAAEQGLQSAIESIEAEAIPDWSLPSEGAARENNRPAAADLPPEIERACPNGSEIAAAMQRLESAIERIKAEAIPASLQRSEHAEYANDCQAAVDLPAERALPPLHAIETVATKQGPESATESIEVQRIPAWLRQPEHDVCAEDVTAANQNEDKPGPIKRLWTRVVGLTSRSYTSSPREDAWLTDLLERASDDADNDEQDFTPKRAPIR
jgi:hypothetical protein